MNPSGRVRVLVIALGLSCTATIAGAQRTISRGRLEQVLGRSATSIRVVRPTGVSDLGANAASVDVRPGDLVFRKMADTAKRGTRVKVPSLPSTAAAWVMPYRWLTIDSAGVERVLIPYFVLASGGLTYDVPSRTYRGVAFVGVEDTLHTDVTVTLVRPLKMQLTTTTGGSVTPPSLAITHTSLDYDSVRIESPDATNVRIRTGADPAGIVIPIPVRALSIGMIPQQPTLPGLGLATTDIAISLPRGVPRSDTAIITFSSTSSPVRPSTVRLTGAEVATVKLRSGIPGRDSISAYLDGVLVGGTSVEFVAPWAFLGAAVTGILIAGLARFFGAKRRKRASALTRDVLKGAPFGVLAAIAGAIGLDWMKLKIDDPAALPAIVITAALGRWLGTRLLEGVVPTAKPTVSS
jgi:hypothetical protein